MLSTRKLQPRGRCGACSGRRTSGRQGPGGRAPPCLSARLSLAPRPRGLSGGLTQAGAPSVKLGLTICWGRSGGSLSLARPPQPGSSRVSGPGGFELPVVAPRPTPSPETDMPYLDPGGPLRPPPPDLPGAPGKELALASLALRPGLVPPAWSHRQPLSTLRLAAPSRTEGSGLGLGLAPPWALGDPPALSLSLSVAHLLCPDMGARPWSGRGSAALMKVPDTHPPQAGSLGTWPYVTALPRAEASLHS